MWPNKSNINPGPSKESIESEDSGDFSPTPPPSYLGHKPKTNLLKVLFGCFSSPKTAKTTTTAFHPGRAAPLSLLPTKFDTSVSLVDLKISSVRCGEHWSSLKKDGSVHMEVKVRATIMASCTGPNGQTLSATRRGWSSAATASAPCTLATMSDGIVKATEKATTEAYAKSYPRAAAKAVAGVEAAFAKEARKALYKKG